MSKQESLDILLLFLQEGGFFSAENADSLPTYESEKKKEGAFCVWTYSELQDLLSNALIDDTKISLADLFCSFYDVKKNGNVRPGQVINLWFCYSVKFLEHERNLVFRH